MRRDCFVRFTSWYRSLACSPISPVHLGQLFSVFPECITNSPNPKSKTGSGRPTRSASPQDIYALSPNSSWLQPFCHALLVCVYLSFSWGLDLLAHTATENSSPPVWPQTPYTESWVFHSPTFQKSGLKVNIPRGLYDTETFLVDPKNQLRVPFPYPKNNLGRPVRVAVLDRGFDLFHPIFSKTILRSADECQQKGTPPTSWKDLDGNGFKGDCEGWDFVRETGVLRDSGDGHGTSVAGLVAHFPYVEILPLIVTHREEGSSTVNGKPVKPITQRLVQALKYALLKKVDILVLSGGIPLLFVTPEFRKAISDLDQAGVLMVVASGNDNHDAPIFPCQLKEVICVQSGNPDGTKALGSSDSAPSILRAPGNYVPAPRPLNLIPSASKIAGWDPVQGTSFSAPQVAGVLAQLRAVFPHEQKESLLARLLSKSPRIPVNLQFAEALVQPYPPPWFRFVFEDSLQVLHSSKHFYLQIERLDSGEMGLEESTPLEVELFLNEELALDSNDSNVGSQASHLSHASQEFQTSQESEESQLSQVSQVSEREATHTSAASQKPQSPQDSLPNTQDSPASGRDPNRANNRNRKSDLKKDVHNVPTPGSQSGFRRKRLGIWRGVLGDFKNSRSKTLSFLLPAWRPEYPLRQKMEAIWRYSDQGQQSHSFQIRWARDPKVLTPHFVSQSRSQRRFTLPSVISQPLFYQIGKSQIEFSDFSQGSVANRSVEVGGSWAPLQIDSQEDKIQQLFRIEKHLVFALVEKKKGFEVWLHSLSESVPTRKWNLKNVADDFPWPNLMPDQKGGSIWISDQEVPFRKLDSRRTQGFLGARLLFVSNGSLFDLFLNPKTDQLFLRSTLDQIPGKGDYRQRFFDQLLLDKSLPYIFEPSAEALRWGSSDPAVLEVLWRWKARDSRRDFLLRTSLPLNRLDQELLEPSIYKRTWIDGLPLASFARPYVGKRSSLHGSTPAQMPWGWFQFWTPHEVEFVDLDSRDIIGLKLPQDNFEKVEGFLGADFGKRENLDGLSKHGLAEDGSAELGGAGSFGSATIATATIITEPITTAPVSSAPNRIGGAAYFESRSLLWQSFSTPDLSFNSDSRLPLFRNTMMSRNFFSYRTQPLISGEIWRGFLLDHSSISEPLLEVVGFTDKDTSLDSLKSSKMVSRSGTSLSVPPECEAMSSFCDELGRCYQVLQCLEPIQNGDLPQFDSTSSKSSQYSDEERSNVSKRAVLDSSRSFRIYAYPIF